MADLADDLTHHQFHVCQINQGYDGGLRLPFFQGGKKIGAPLVKSLLSQTAGFVDAAAFGHPTHDITNAFKML